MHLRNSCLLAFVYALAAARVCTDACAAARQGWDDLQGNDLKDVQTTAYAALAFAGVIGTVAAFTDG